MKRGPNKETSKAGEDIFSGVPGFLASSSFRFRQSQDFAERLPLPPIKVVFVRSSPFESWNFTQTAHQAILVVSTLLASWLGMQAAHESGHVLGALFTGGEIAAVVLHPLTISHTEMIENPHPLVVVWAGPLVGVLLPLLLWGLLSATGVPGAFVARFFAGFCLVANGAYLGVGSFFGTGDCGEMLRQGSSAWVLRLFGAIAVPIGFCLWNGQGPNFGLGPSQGKVNHRVAYATLVIFSLLVLLGLIVDGA
jgi:hypothetical protein